MVNRRYELVDVHSDSLYICVADLNVRRSAYRNSVIVQCHCNWRVRRSFYNIDTISGNLAKSTNGCSGEGLFYLPLNKSMLT